MKISNGVLDIIHYQNQGGHNFLCQQGWYRDHNLVPYLRGGVFLMCSSLIRKAGYPI